jgi:hypothetical protein
MGYFAELSCNADTSIEVGDFDGWVTSEGDYVRIPKMSNEHLQNTIKVLERRRHKPFIKIERMREVLQSRGL